MIKRLKGQRSKKLLIPHLPRIQSPAINSIKSIQNHQIRTRDKILSASIFISTTRIKKLPELVSIHLLNKDLLFFQIIFFCNKTLIPITVELSKTHLELILWQLFELFCQILFDKLSICTNCSPFINVFRGQEEIRRPEDGRVVWVI